MVNDKAVGAVRSNNNRITGSRLTPDVTKTPRKPYDHFVKLDVTGGTKMGF
jgi:hypothetical protein